MTAAAWRWRRYQFVSSVGRLSLSWTGFIPLNAAVRDELGVFVTRALIAYLMHNRRWAVRGFDAVLAEEFGLLLASLVPGGIIPSVLSEVNMYSSTTGPVRAGSG